MTTDLAADAQLTTTADCLRHWAKVKPDHPALRSAAGQLTYAQLDEHASRLAQALSSAGVGKGDRVAYLDKNSPEQLELFFASAKLGAVATPVNYRLAPPEVAQILADSQAKVLAVGAEFVASIRKIATGLDGVRVVVIGEPHEDWPSLVHWRDSHQPVDPYIEVRSSDVACQLYSSGTTGHPKGVELTYGNLCVIRDLYPTIMGLGPDSVSIVPMPLYHIVGTGWAMAGFWQGATNVLVREVVPEQLVATMIAEHVTHACIAPVVVQLMLAVPGVEDRDWSALEAILYGGSPISETVLAQSVRTFGCNFVQGYGLTESTGTIMYLPAADHDPEGPNRHRLRACGIPTPGHEAKIVDAVTGEEQPDGQVGEIWARGPSVMVGYWDLPEQTAESIRPGGWLRTGDAAYRDGDGYFYIQDRVKDMIVSGGENVYPSEVENAIMSHPDVSDVAVIGVPHDKWGETPLALIVPVTGSDLTEADLIAYCRERLAGFKCPTSVQCLDELPRNPSGKVLKAELRAPFWKGRARMVG